MTEWTYRATKKLRRRNWDGFRVVIAMSVPEYHAGLSDIREGRADILIARTDASTDLAMPSEIAAACEDVHFAIGKHVDPSRLPAARALVDMTAEVLHDTPLVPRLTPAQRARLRNRRYYWRHHDRVRAFKNAYQTARRARLRAAGIPRKQYRRKPLPQEKREIARLRSAKWRADKKARASGVTENVRDAHPWRARSRGARRQESQ